MPVFHESRERVAILRQRFREHYEHAARFREDKALAEPLAADAEPLLRALLSITVQDQASDLHDAYAAMAQLAAHAAQLGATPSVLVTLPAAIVLTLQAEDLLLSPAQREQLSIVSAEAYVAARDEQARRALRRQAADSQVAVRLAPRCCAIFLAGSHHDVDLEPTLERYARELLRNDVVSCLLDVSRLVPLDEELARVLGRFCAQAATLGVRTTLVSRGPELASWFTSWSLLGPLTRFEDEYDRAQRAALAAADLQLRPRRPWARLFLPDRHGLVR